MRFYATITAVLTVAVLVTIFAGSAALTGVAALLAVRAEKNLRHWLTQLGR